MHNKVYQPMNTRLYQPNNFNRPILQSPKSTVTYRQWRSKGRESHGVDGRPIDEERSVHLILPQNSQTPFHYRSFNLLVIVARLFNIT